MEKEKRISPLYLIVCVAAAGLFTLLAAKGGVQTDEAYALALLRRGFADIWHISAAGANPPLYYYAAKLFSMPFGYSQYAVRLFSGICYLLITAIGGWEITRFWGKKMGLTFMVLFPLYPFAMEHAAQAGVYALAALLVFLNVLFAYRAWKSNMAGDWIGFGAAGICAAYCHNFALVTVIAVYVLLLLCALVRNRKLLKGWLIAAVSCAVLYIPWMKHFVRQMTALADQEAQITAQGLVNGGAALLHAAGNVTFPLFFGAVLLLILLGVILRRQAAPLLAAGVCVLTAGAGIAVSVLVQPVFRVEDLAPCASLLAFVLAWGVCAIRRETIFGGVMGFLLVGFAGNLVYGFLPAPADENQFNQAVTAAHSEAQAYVVLSENGVHIQQLVAYLCPELPVYAQETLGDANPYVNIHTMEEFDGEGLDTILAVADAGSRPIGGFPRGFQADLIGTYQAEGDSFDLWLLQRQTAQEESE